MSSNDNVMVFFQTYYVETDSCTYLHERFSGKKFHTSATRFWCKYYNFVVKLIKGSRVLKSDYCFSPQGNSSLIGDRGRSSQNTQQKFPITFFYSCR